MCNLRPHKMAIELMNFSYFSLCLVSFVLLRGIYYIPPHYYLLSEKLVAALIVTRCGAETKLITLTKQCNIWVDSFAAYAYSSLKFSR